MSNEVVKQPNGADVWDKILSTSLKLPYVKVDRESFLRKELSLYCSKEQIAKIINSRPQDHVSEELIDAIANACIKNHTTKVSALSFAAGLPGGFAMAATIPGDVAQYYYHVLVLAQKLAYLYGFPSLTDENGDLTETSRGMLTIFVGVMLGANAANAALAEISKRLGAEALKRIPNKPLMKTMWYPLLRQITKWIGIRMSRPLLAKWVSKAIPVVGGFVSGGVSLATFYPQAKRLQRKLKESMNQRDNNTPQNPIYKEEDYTEFSEE